MHRFRQARSVGGTDSWGWLLSWLQPKLRPFFFFFDVHRFFFFPPLSFRKLQLSIKVGQQCKEMKNGEVTNLNRLNSREIWHQLFKVFLVNVNHMCHLITSEHKQSNPKTKYENSFLLLFWFFCPPTPPLPKRREIKTYFILVAPAHVINTQEETSSN